MPFFTTPDAGTDGADHDAWLTPGRFAALLAVLTLVSYPQIFFGLQTFVYRDFGLFSYPLAYHLQDSFRHGQLPLWDPLNNCGTPFLAQWNTQVLYPPALFYLLLPLSWSLGVFCVLHLFWGGLGMYFLARHWTQNPVAAALAGIVFAFSGLMLNSLIWPATVAGLGWMPWVVWLTGRAVREGGRMLVIAALAGTLQMLSGGTEAVLLTWCWLGVSIAFDTLQESDLRGTRFRRGGLIVLLITGLSAAQLLPFFELLDFSRRQQNITAALWPMPTSGWANFFVPLFHCHSFQGMFLQDGQSWINSYYVGVATVALALVALWQVRSARVWLPAGVAGFFFILALGEATPVYRWLARHIHAIGLMRFPIKFVILPVFVLPLLAAFGLAAQSQDAGTRPNRRLTGWAGLGFVVVGLILGILIWHWRSQPAGSDRTFILWNGVARAVFFTAIFGGWWLIKRIKTPKMRRYGQLVLLLLVWLDLFLQAPRPQTVNRTIYQPGLSRTLPAPKWGEGRALVPFDTSFAFGHVFLPDVAADYLGRRFLLAGDCNLLDGIPNCNGFFPLYLSRFAALFYNYYGNDTPDTLLDFIGVSETLTVLTNRCEWTARSGGMPLLTGGQQPVFTDDLGGVQAFTNADFNPRREVCLPVEAKGSIAAGNPVVVTISAPKYAAGRIEAQVEAASPTLLVAAQIYYPAWHAYVDDQPARVWPANFAFQAFALPAGQHRVRLVYADQRFYLGAAISLVTLAGSLVFLAWSWRRPVSGEKVNG